MIKRYPKSHTNVKTKIVHRYHLSYGCFYFPLAKGDPPLPLSFDKIRTVSLVELFAKEGKNDSLDYVKSLNLKSIMDISAQGVWLYKNKVALEKVKKGLSQKITMKRGSF